MDNVRVNVTGDKVTEGKHWFNGFGSWLDWGGDIGGRMKGVEEGEADKLREMTGSEDDRVMFPNKKTTISHSKGVANE